MAMAGAAIDADLRDHLTRLRKDDVQSVAVSEIGEIVESVLASLQGDVSDVDLQLFGELESLATFIRAAKGEIAAIRPEEIRELHIPSATDELDAIVGATESATGDIMAAAEQIEKIAEGLNDTDAEQLVDQVMRIYEACSFQDITGQRITKIIATLQKIEASVEGMLAAFGDEAARQRVAKLAAPIAEPTPDSDAALLHGPQLEGSGNSQDEIDKIMAGFD